MNTTLLTRSMHVGVNPRSPGIPEDLRFWIPETELVDLVSFTAHRLDGGGEADPLAIFGPPRFQRALVSTLAFCYATGVYATADVEWRAVGDEHVQRLSEGFAFDAHHLRLARAQNRELLTSCLAAVIEQAWKTQTARRNGSDSEFRWKATTPISSLAAPARSLPLDDCGTSWMNSRWRFRADADQRIQRAFLVDLAQERSPHR